MCFTDLPEFKIVGNFRINKAVLLGGGGNGSVYEAENITSKEKVAAKEIKMTRQEEINKKIRKEVDVLSNIPSHPNIIHFYDHKIENVFLWIFMELCPLGNLDEYCTNHIISNRKKFGMMIQICKAIQHLHHLKNPIAHRDVKPMNVLVQEVDGKVQMKLCDFGVSNYVTITSMTRMFQTFVGTRDYMPPELFGDVKYDLKVDIFSTALLIYGFLDAQEQRIRPITG